MSHGWTRFRVCLERRAQSLQRQNKRPTPYCRAIIEDAQQAGIGCGVHARRAVAIGPQLRLHLALLAPLLWLTANSDFGDTGYRLNSHPTTTTKKIMPTIATGTV